MEFKQVSDFKALYATLLGYVRVLKAKVPLLECSNPLQQSQSIIYKVLQETFEHERCLPNFIVYDVLETILNDTSLRIEHEKDTVANALGSLDNAVLANFKLICLGKFC